MSDSLSVYCSCGQKIVTTGGNIPLVAIYRNEELVYSKCSHGVVTLDIRTLEEKDFGPREIELRESV